jgi:hypothetical protein
LEALLEEISFEEELMDINEKESNLKNFWEGIIVVDIIAYPMPVKSIFVTRPSL